MERKKSGRMTGVALAGGSWAAAFLFWFLAYPYHFLRREQLMLFMLDRESLGSYFHGNGWIPALCADFLTQFFCIPAAGPAICALVVAAIAWLVYLIMTEYTSIWLGLVAGAAAAVLAFLRDCGLDGALAANLAIVFWLALALLIIKMGKKGMSYGLISLSLAISGILLVGMPKSKLVSGISLEDEHILALDIEAYNGNWEKLRELSAKSKDSNISAYFRNLGNASRNELSSRLMEGYQPFERGLFLQVGEKSSPYAIAASGEVWYRLGEMTMAEHSAILGMIFSPRQTGSRFVRRLAEINLVNGDDEAAMKYLRMLGNTIMWKRWADEHTPGKQSAKVQSELAQLKALVPSRDVVNGTNEKRNLLVNLLNSNPDNIMAHEYLLCYDLLTEDLESFIQDYSRGVIPVRVFSEAALLYLVRAGQLSQESISYFQISESLYRDFQAFNQAYEQSGGKASELKEKFGNTYWFFYCFAKRNE